LKMKKIKVLRIISNFVTFATLLSSISCQELCKTIQINLKNEALSAQGTLEGTYTLSTVLSNGEANWVSDTKAIWAYPKKKIWLIGSLSKLGGEIAGVYARRVEGAGPDSDSIVWNYSSGGWKRDDAKDIELKCQDVSERFFSGGKSCLTTNDGPQKNALCILPFKFEGKLKNTCINDQDPDGRFWCTTKVDKDLNHIGGQGNWGYCGSSCPSTVPRTITAAPPVVFTTKAPRTTRRPTRRTTTRRTTTRRTTRRPASGIKISQSGIPPKPPPNGVTDPSAGDYHPTEKEATCGEYLGTGFIVGGEITKRGELPYHAALGYKSKRRGRRGKFDYNCGGTLINRRYVITAAHCTIKPIAEVVIGDWDLEHDPDCKGSNTCANALGTKAQRFRINQDKDVIIHEDWDLSRVVDNGNDIALVRLPRLAITANEDFDQIVHPACLGWDNTIQVPGEQYMVSGWGRTSNNVFDRGDLKESGAHSSKLQKLIVPLVPLDQCKANNKAFQDITIKQMCAGGLIGKDSCSGDSGGPLVAMERDSDVLNKKPKYLVGIVSFGSRKCGRGLPGVYTSIDYYLPWIINNMKP